ncbi:DEAD/DEAH box helicase [Crossiella cryophila]|uniref:Replicative superfamily II helicase n=1 Tax=Crossiella cryophila TaxID=43355 RepID=A0A7W7CAJ3_9PSEU|nr:DEAD/DEAH box helicase [Crossiella cryophila]MBB4677447.1 replicative superfamily II helicase [Crossiella cryophila]
MSSAFHGLFIGIDNYRDPAFRRLKFAGRDARVLHALFSDNTGGDCVLLPDEEATRTGVTAELTRLAEVSGDGDIVVVTFSGHGTRSRELATYDATPGRFAETALPLTEFVDRVREIRARLLVVVLDSCFSGGMLARAFFEPDDGAAARSDEVGAWDVLRSISGDGRIFLGAASSDEEAFESTRYQHGVLTHHLLQGLMGAGGVLDGRGMVRLSSLVAQLLDRVSAEETGSRRRRQRPTFEGTMRLTRFPPLVPGKRYTAIGGHTQPPLANKDLKSLVPHGIPSSVVELWRERFGKLNDVQVAAINHGGLLRGENVLVSAPTASGKTLVGEIAALHAVAHNRKAVFLLPSRTLVNEQYERFQDTYGPLGVQVLRATGGVRDQVSDLITGAYQVAVVTYETFIGLLAGHARLLDGIGVMVVDEIQSLLLPDRGPRLELLFTRLRRAVKRHLPTPQLVGLSAVLGDPEELAAWFSAALVQFPDRAVPLCEGVLGPDGTYRYRRHGGGLAPVAKAEQQILTTSGLVAGDDLAERLVGELVAQGNRVLVFRANRAGARAFARRLADRLGLPAASSVLSTLPRGDVSRVAEVLRDCLGSGVAFHNTDLRESEQQAVVRGFREPAGEIRVVVATTTLAQGVNLSADSVVICELEHPGRPGRSYTSSEYKNMAGRAGRNLGQDVPGRTIVVTNGGLETQRIWRDYVNAEPEQARSALLSPGLDLANLALNVLKCLADEPGGADAAGVADFLAWTFASFQSSTARADDPFPPDEVRAVVGSLHEGGFLAISEHGYQLTTLGEVVVRSGLRIESARVLVATLGAVTDVELTRMTLIGAAQLVTEVDEVRFTKPSAKWQREYDDFARQLPRQGAAPAVAAALLGPRSRDRAGNGRARRALACQMWSAGQPISKIETALTLHLQSQAGVRDPGPIAQAAQRTADVIRAVVDIARHLHPETDLGDLAETLPCRLSEGIGKGLAHIARHVGRRVEREVYLSLAQAGLSVPEAIATAGTEQLLDCADGDEDLATALRAAAEAAVAEANQPTLDDLVDLPED